jgi:hypothetical protein
MHRRDALPHVILSYSLVTNMGEIDYFFCVGVVYLGEYDICDVTLSVYTHRASLKIYTLRVTSQISCVKLFY